MPQNRDSQRTIQNILNVSARLFQEKGYEQTTITDIVNEMNVTRGSFYHHFKSKEAVLYALSEQRPYKIIFSEIQKTQGITGLEKLRKLLIYSLDSSFSTRNANHTQETLALLKNPRILSEYISDLQNEMLEMVKPFVEEAMRDGSIEDGDATIVTEFILLLFSFWLIPTLYPGDKEYVNKKIIIIKIALDSIGCKLVDTNLIGYITTCIGEL